ncbi:hypothetical protein IEQ34_014569 [Dendrobium chrysotoxum]|uniref:Uncharacterized protein n=1 Tax=Dendrobium chrysotoxum TaxID=161865 RepID=A0AAV7GM99_DENCH|nr:hypothetical protein IEQ34_014569 [Dendrobium chrysotoxum]
MFHITTTLFSHYVRTYKYLLERDGGKPILLNVFFDLHGAAGIAQGAVAASRILTRQINLAGVLALPT